MSTCSDQQYIKRTEESIMSEENTAIVFSKGATPNEADQMTKVPGIEMIPRHWWQYYM